MKKRFALIMTNTLLLLFLSVKVFAAEFTTSDISKTMYTTENTQVYTQPDATLSPVAVVESGIPVQVTGITSNGWYRITVDTAYYIPKNLLAENTAVIKIATRSYQEEMSATLDSAADIPNILQKAFDAHAATVRITSNTNVFSDLANELNAQIGGLIGRYNVHSCNGYHLSRKGNSYIITLSWLSTIAEEQALDAYIQKTIGSYSEGSAYQKVKKVHDAICNTVAYDNTTAAGQADNNSAYDAVANKLSVCTGYALLFQKYMDGLGIPCYTAAGTRNGGPHMWNIVNIDGQWYHIDCTWDDQSSYISNQWFLCGADRAGYSSWGNVTLAETSYPYE